MGTRVVITPPIFTLKLEILESIVPQVVQWSEIPEILSPFEHLQAFGGVHLDRKESVETTLQTLDSNSIIKVAH